MHLDPRIAVEKSPKRRGIFRVGFATGQSVILSKHRLYQLRRSQVATRFGDQPEIAFQRR